MRNDANVDVLPKESLKKSVNIIFFFSMGIYIVMTAVYVSICCTKNEILSLVVAIIEIILYSLALVLCIIATVISDKVIKKWLNNLEELDRFAGTYKTEVLINCRKSIKKAESNLKKIKIGCSIIFVICFCTCIVCYAIEQYSVISIINIAISCVSAFVSILLSLISTQTMWSLGIYIPALINELFEKNKELINRVNDLEIELSLTRD